MRIVKNRSKREIERSIQTNNHLQDLNITLLFHLLPSFANINNPLQKVTKNDQSLLQLESRL